MLTLLDFGPQKPNLLPHILHIATFILVCAKERKQLVVLGKGKDRHNNQKDLIHVPWDQPVQPTFIIVCTKERIQSVVSETGPNSW